MFIDEEWKKQLSISKSEQAPEIKRKGLLYNQSFVLLALILIFIGGVLTIYFVMFNQNKTPFPVIKNNQGTTTKIGLPSTLIPNPDNTTGGFLPDNLRAEDLRFGSFYKAPQRFLGIKVESGKFPINIKSDVVNYYDISRKVDIKNKISDLDKNGFSMLDQQPDISGSDFFTAYRKLLDNEVPVYVSSDFVWYYYQNSLKDAYKEIEKSVFFENMWDINKKFYDIALTRYRKHLGQVGVVNDPLLEGERLQAAYWAVSLYLLKPKEKQVNVKDKFTDERLFSLQEDQEYFFDIPVEINREMEKEIKLIQGAGVVTRSPIFLYEKDYSIFKVPEEYSRNAKLNNYYLAKKWLNSIFPLYFRNEECPNCLLDYNDWMNNFVAAILIAEDFKNNQDLKNRWAAIYKFISFFEGLRSDLTYLHVNDAMGKEYPSAYSLPEIFSNSNKNRKENILSLQNRLADYRFLAIEGSLDRTDLALRPQLGVRILQDNYWPNDYLSSQLTGRELTMGAGGSTLDNQNFCEFGNNNKKEERIVYRCKASGVDILNLLSILPSSNSEYNKIVNYKNYELKMAGINDELKKFDIDTWNMNSYWINFDLAKNYISYNQDLLKPLSLGPSWLESKITNTVLSSWVNIGLPADEWEKYQEVRKSNLGYSYTCDLRNFVEPNTFFYADLIERNNILLKAVDILRVGKKTNSVSIAISELNKKIMDLKNISEKELVGEGISEEECRTVKEFITGYKVIRLGNKSMTWGSLGHKVKETIAGVKLMAYIYNLKKDERVMVVGPVFNYKEILGK